jgi:YidC/Oxa1 family membrane protein insertase
MFTTILIQPLTNGLILFYKLLGNNLGLAIIGFSLFLRFLLNPLTKPYMESMRKMKEFAPQLEKLRRKHKDDKIKQAQAQSEFYKQKGINPGAGCLPYLLQIVVLIAFFNVFTRTLTPDGNPVERFNALLYGPLKFQQNQAINTKFLYLDVTKPDKFNIPQIPFPIPGPILILAALIQLLSSKIMAPVTQKQEKAAQKTPQTADDMQVAMQQSMIYTFPLFTIIIGMSFPSGLALYWLLFSVWQFLQQYNTYGLGGLKPWLERLSLVKSDPRLRQNGKKKKRD